MKFAVGPCLILLVFSVARGQVPTPTPSPTPVQIREEVIVTANRTETRLGDTAASVTTFSRAEIDTAAAPTVDDLLRQSTGFSIFRRSSSRNANPTTQGVSLRGVGASGASRSIILFDGVALNDPFGGWVQWNRVPPIMVERVEVLRGGASSLYGESSLSGAINVMPRESRDPFVFSADVFTGTQKTFSGSGFVGARAGDWRGDVTASGFQTKGYIPVDEGVRGPVDVFAGVRAANLSSRLTRTFGPGGSLFVRPSWFGEVRTNGTGLQTNRTHIRGLIVGGNNSFGRTGNAGLSWRLFGGTQVFDQISSAISTDRTSETLTRVQRVPVTSKGLSVQFSGVYKAQTFVGGVESRQVRGTSDEIAFAVGRPNGLVAAGGRQRFAAVFLHDVARAGKRTVIAGSVRFDHWQNYKASSTERVLLTGLTTTNRFADRSEHALSPRLAVLYKLSDDLSIYANTSLSFRSPTLNELYRSFRVGNVLTLANDNLLSERARNVEGGISFSRHRTAVRVNGFWTRIDQAIANVTLASTPSLITRQRQNAGRTLSRGIEAEAEVRIKYVSLSGGYLFVDSHVASFPSNRALEGLKVPQVARHQLSFQATVAAAGWTAGIQGRASSEQFDDDLNLFRLEPYSQVDVFVSKRLHDNLTAYAAIENIINSRYSVARTPIRTVSSPISLRVGLRWK